MSRLAAALVAVLIGLAIVLPEPASAAADTPPTVRLTVTDVAPSSVSPPGPGTVTFSLVLTNTTDRALDDVTVVLRRGEPVDTEAQLDKLLADPRPSPGWLSTDPEDKPLGHPLPAHGSATVQYQQSVSVQTTSDICLCKSPGTVYPIEFTAVVGGQDAGYTETYLPAFEQAPKPVPVGWLWPVLDRPHRLNQDTVFLDDDLAASLAPGGRLYRLLQVAGNLPPTVRLTLVLDPQLIDEVEVMASGNYRVVVPGGTAPGTGGSAAAAWLDVLRALTVRNEVTLTPWGDPDLDTVSAAGLAWPVGVTAAERSRVTRALGGDPGSALLWPPGGSVSPTVLAKAQQDGTRAVVLDAAGVSRDSSVEPRPSSLVTVAGMMAAVTDPDVERLADVALTAARSGTDGPAATPLPALLALVSLRASQRPDAPNYLVIAPDRYLDPDVDRATRVLLETTSAFFDTAAPVGAATAAGGSERTATLASPASQARLPQSNVDAALHATAATATVADATRFAETSVLNGLPLAIRGDESAWWGVHPDQGPGYAARVTALATSLVDAVTIIQPAQGSYTLGSADSFLFVTVSNELSAPATVRLSVSTAGGVAGFRADDLVQTVPAASRLTMKVAVHAERSGHFQVVGVLHTLSGHQLGDRLRLSVNATSLGGIGVVITEVAAGVLALALCVRVLRRVRARRAPVGRW